MSLVILAQISHEVVLHVSILFCYFYILWHTIDNETYTDKTLSRCKVFFWIK